MSPDMASLDRPSGREPAAHGQRPPGRRATRKMAGSPGYQHSEEGKRLQSFAAGGIEEITALAVENQADIQIQRLTETAMALRHHHLFTRKRGHVRVWSPVGSNE